MQPEKDGKTPVPKGHGRPRGVQYDTTFNVRLPRPTLEALKELARLEKCTVSQAVRAGILAQMAKVLPQLIATAKNVDRAGSRRLKAIQRIRLLLRAELHLGPVGLELARARARGLLQEPLQRA